MTLDYPLFELIHSFAGRSGFLDGTGIFFARFLPWLLIVLFFIKLLLEKNWRVRFYTLSLALLSITLARGVIVELIHFFYYRPRPPLVFSFESLIPLPASSAFPSSHATVFFALGMALFFIYRRWGIWFLSAAVLIGAARVFVGAHWPLDILFGAVIGIVSAYAIKKLLPALERYRESEQRP